MKSNPRPTFVYTSDFDQNGILYWIGTNGKTTSDYTNPCSTGLVSGRIQLSSFSSFISLLSLVTCSDPNSSTQQLSELISHSPISEENEDANRGFSWIIIDLGLMILPTHLTLRHATGGFAHWTKSLVFQISRDPIHFGPCETTVLGDNSSPIASWSIKNLPENCPGFRYIRMHQKCARHPMNIAGFEIYGQVLSSIDIRSSKNSHPLISSSFSIIISESELARSRQKPAYGHSHSTSAAANRMTKMSSHIFRRLISMDPALASNENRATPPSTTIDRILLDLSSIPTDLSTGTRDRERQNIALDFSFVSSSSSIR